MWINAYAKKRYVCRDAHSICISFDCNCNYNFILFITVKHTTQRSAKTGALPLNWLAYNWIGYWRHLPRSKNSTHFFLSLTMLNKMLRLFPLVWCAIQLIYMMWLGNLKAKKRKKNYKHSHIYTTHTRSACCENKKLHCVVICCYFQNEIIYFECVCVYVLTLLPLFTS